MKKENLKLVKEILSKIEKIDEELKDWDKVKGAEFYIPIVALMLDSKHKPTVFLDDKINATRMMKEKYIKFPAFNDFVKNQIKYLTEESEKLQNKLNGL